MPCCFDYDSSCLAVSKSIVAVMIGVTFISFALFILLFIQLARVTDSMLYN